jgi:hypothetical protein
MYERQVNVIFFKKHLQILLVLGSLLSAGSLQAQINTEAMRQQDLGLGSHFMLGANLSFIQGNSSIFQSHLKSRWDYILARSNFFIILNQKISRKDDKVFINQGFGHIRAVKNVTHKLQGELFLQQEYNEFINLQSRKLIGLGIRVSHQNPTQVPNNPAALAFVLGLGFMFEQEEMDAGPLGLLGDPVHGELARLLRSSNYVVVKWAPSPSLSVTTTSYYQVDTRRLADYRMLSQSQARLGLTEKLALNFTLNLRYDSEPPANIENLDLEFSQGLTYSF